MTSDGAAAKREMRAAIRAERTARPAAERESAAVGIRIQLDALVTRIGATTLTCYLSSPTEPGTREFVDEGTRRGLRILLPASRDDGLLDWTEADPDAGEVATALGVPEGAGTRLASDALDGIGLMLAPASAIDRDGFRMGWGRGYYDRAIASLAHRPPVYAVIYDAELVDRVPREPHDQRVDGVVTPTRTITFAR